MLAGEILYVGSNTNLISLQEIKEHVTSIRQLINQNSILYKTYTEIEAVSLQEEINKSPKQVW